MFLKDKIENFSASLLFLVVLSTIRLNGTSTISATRSINGTNTTTAELTTSAAPTTTEEPMQNCSVLLDNSTVCDEEADSPLLCYYYNETSNMTYCEFYYFLYPPTTTVPFVWTDLSTRWITPEFIGRKSTTKTTTLPPVPPVTYSPHTIPCPKCSLVNEIVECQTEPVRCDQYEGCWYYTNRAGLQTKGCKDIIPVESGLVPDICTSFYKTRYCLKGHCLSCDLKGVGDARRLSSNTLLTISACLLVYILQFHHY